MMDKELNKTCGQFSIEGQYGGYPHWHTITLAGAEFRHLKIEDIHDLRYLLERAIAHHEQYGHKAT